MNARIVLVLAFALTPGCGGGGNDSTPAVPSRFLYASAYAGPNTFPAAIYGLAVNTGGALNPGPGSPASTSDGGGPIAITRDSKVLYTTTNNGPLLAWEINADGSLTNAPVPSYAMSDTQVGLAAHPTADFLYASGNSGVLTVLAIDSATGALSPASSVTLTNKIPQEFCSDNTQRAIRLPERSGPQRRLVPHVSATRGFLRGLGDRCAQPRSGEPPNADHPLSLYDFQHGADGH